MINFSRRKFLLFSTSKQHKKCAELIREMFSYLKKGETIPEAMALHYDELLSWMEVTPLKDKNFQSLSDRFHHHLQFAGVCLREHRLLPAKGFSASAIRKKDRDREKEALPIAIYLDHIRSAHNVGSILRTIEAFALGTVYFSEQTPSKDHKQVQDTSMGAFQWVNCQQNVLLKDLPKPIIALETSGEAIPLHQFLFPDTFTLVVGNEEYGCSSEVLEQADFLVEIPLFGRKNSLNVANALAITAAEIRRQLL